MRRQQAHDENRGLKGKCDVTVPLNRFVVKSSSQRLAKKRKLQRLAERLGVGAEITDAREQMAGDSGEAKRLSKRPFHINIDGEGCSSGEGMNATVKIKPGKKTIRDPHDGKERRGKENSAAKTTELTHRSAKGSSEKMEDGGIHGSDTVTREDPSIFFDEDSNHVFPVGQFFGNLDVVQEDYPRCKATLSDPMSRRECRRRHYFAKDDSDEEDLRDPS